MIEARIILYDYPASICCQMTRLVLAEKNASFERRHVDIMARAEQFEPWYVAINPKAVVPTLIMGGEVTTDTITIVKRIDREVEGPSLTPLSHKRSEDMDSLMREIMALHYGVLLYSRRIDENGKSPIVVERGELLRARLREYPEQAALLQPRIGSNDRLQKILADPIAVERCFDEARRLVARIDEALREGLFVSGDSYTLSDAFATAALARFQLHGLSQWWSGGANPSVAEYYARMRERTSWGLAGVVELGSERDV